MYKQPEMAIQKGVPREGRASWTFYHLPSGTKASQPPRVYGSVLGMETSSMLEPGLCKQGIAEGTWGWPFTANMQKTRP